MSLINIYEGWNAKLQLSGIWGRCTLVSQVYANKFRLQLFLTIIYHHGKKSSHCSLKLNFTLELYYSITFWDIMIKKNPTFCNSWSKKLSHNQEMTCSHKHQWQHPSWKHLHHHVHIYNKFKCWHQIMKAQLFCKVGVNTNSSDLTPIYIYM